MPDGVGERGATVALEGIVVHVDVGVAYGERLRCSEVEVNGPRLVPVSLDQLVLHYYYYYYQCITSKSAVQYRQYNREL